MWLLSCSWSFVYRVEENARRGIHICHSDELQKVRPKTKRTRDDFESARFVPVPLSLLFSSLFFSPSFYSHLKCSIIISYHFVIGSRPAKPTEYNRVNSLRLSELKAVGVMFVCDYERIEWIHFDLEVLSAPLHNEFRGSMTQHEMWSEEPETKNKLNKFMAERHVTTEQWNDLILTCEIETRSSVSLIFKRSWRTASKNEPTLMHAICFGRTRIFVRKRSTRFVATNRTSLGRSYQTFKQRRTWAAPSRAPTVTSPFYS